MTRCVEDRGRDFAPGGAKDIEPTSWPGGARRRGIFVHRSFAAVVFALSAACELAGAWADPHEIASAVLFVRQQLLPASAPADGSEARPFSTLQAALNAAPAGALLRIEAGVYREKLVITRPVVLLGRGAGRTRLVAVDAQSTALEGRGADHVQIFGLSIEGGTNCAIFTGGAVKLQRVELRGCSEAALVGRGAQIELSTSTVSDVSGGRDGRGVDVQRGSLEARGVVFHAAGRRAIVLNGGKGLLEDVEVR